MTVESVLLTLLWIVVLFAIGWLGHWVVTTFFAEPIRTPALLLLGVVLLIIVVYMLLRISGLGGHRLL